MQQKQHTASKMPKNKGVAAPTSSVIPFDPFSQELPRNCRFSEASHAEYIQIGQMVDDPRMVITKIHKIDNETLMSAFEYKRAQRMDFSEHLMFHGTSEACANEISKNNFDWRLSGNNVGHKYGHGVNFSPSFKYAAWYSDKSVYERVVIGARVLIGRSCRGNPNMIVPPKGFDTTQNWDGRVIVKYEENEMVPVYKIYYHKQSYNNCYKNESENYFFNDNHLLHDQFMSFSDTPCQNGNFHRNDYFISNQQRFAPYKKKSRWSQPIQNHGSFYNNNNNTFNNSCSNDSFVNNDGGFANNINHFVNNCFVNNDHFQNDHWSNNNNNTHFDGNNRFVQNNRFVGTNRFANNFISPWH